MLLEVRDVWYSYPGSIVALKGASLRVNKGEIVGVIGPNGCGKTTLLLIAAGLIEPKRGIVLLEGEPLGKQLPEARRKIGIVFQDPDDQLFNSTVYDEIAYALRQLESNGERVDRSVREIARRLGVVELLDRAPYRLSVGEKKIVALASILVYRPQIVLLDEPTSNVSASTINIIEEVILKLKSEGRSVVIASHNMEFVARIADRIYVMRKGKTIGEGPAREILSNTKLLEKADLKPPYSIRVAELLGLRASSVKKPLTLEELVEALKPLFKTEHHN